MNLGDQIRNRRKQLNLSQEYVAEQLGVSRQAVSKWETGQSEPTAGNLIQLAEILEISLSELIEPQEQEETKIQRENGRIGKQPNLILQANLIKSAIILHAAMMRSSVISIHAYLDDPDRRNMYLGFVVFQLIMLLLCSVWMTCNHRFEADRQQRQRNLHIEIGYCIIQALAAITDICLNLGAVYTVILLTVALIYILYVNPRFMCRKLTK